MTVEFFGRGVARGGAREASWAGVGARRTIFFDLRVVSWRVSAKGGLRMPIFGVIMNFWLAVGMDKSLEMRLERWAMVDSGENAKVCGVP